MHIVFVSGSMLGGGAERVVALLSNQFVQLGFKVSIVVVRGESVYKLDNRVELSPVYQENEVQTNIINKVIRRFNFYPKLFKRIYDKKPDLVITVHGGFNGIIILMSKIMGVPVIASEHTNHKVGSSNLWRWIEKHIIYRFADVLTVLTNFDYKYYSKFLTNVKILHNPSTFTPIKEINHREKTILAIGRLNSWNSKGFDNLILVFSKVTKKYPDWRLQIAGSGNEGKIYLTNLIKKLEVDNKVDFLDFQKDIHYVMQKSSIFILSSRFEGFPLVLLEAMSQGCTCISFNCNSGPNEIITNEIDGILVEDQNIEAMVHQLDRLISDDKLRKKLAIAGLKKAEKFSIKKISKQWLDLFETIEKRKLK